MADVTITAKDNGPFLITDADSVTVADAEGNAFATDCKAIALCRCGASTNQPFCTGNHKSIGFESAPRASAD